MNSQILLIIILYLLYSHAEKPANIIIDGEFGDWNGVRRYHDPIDNIDGSVLQDFVPDCHNISTTGKCDRPSHVYNPIIDISEYAIAHNGDILYAYIKVVGDIRLTSIGEGVEAGRTYLKVMLDVDNNLETGFCGNEGGYYPEACGFDMGFAIEIFNGSVNWGSVLFHAMTNQTDFAEARKEVLNNTVNFRYGHYNPHLQWVYWDDSVPITTEEEERCSDGPYNLSGPNHPKICFVTDTCDCRFSGVMDYAFSSDNHSIEFAIPYKAFLNLPDGTPALKLGSKISIAIDTQTSDFYSTPQIWVSDSTWPIRGYLFEPTDAITPNQNLWEDRLIAGAIGLVIGAVIATIICLLATSLHKKGYKPVT